MATTERRLRPALNGLPVTASARDLLGTGAPWFEGWLEHPDATDPFWAPLQCGAALQRTTVPTLLVGGWQDLFLAQTLEQYRVLSGRGVPTRLLVGPWTHLDVETKGGAAIAESLAWLDRYLGPGAAAADAGAADATPGRGADGRPENSVRVWVGGAAGAGLARRLRLAPRKLPRAALAPGPARHPGSAAVQRSGQRPVPLRSGRPHPVGRRGGDDPHRGGA